MLHFRLLITKKYYNDAEIIDELINEDIAELEKYLNERIVELYEAKGYQQGRHAYILYRNKLTEIKYKLRDNLRP